MLQIYKPNGATINLMGVPHISGDTALRPFRYLYSYKIDEGIFVYNFLTGELLLLTDEEYSTFNNKIDINSELGRSLFEKWFLVPAEHDDVNLVNQVRTLLKTVVYSNTEAPIRQFTILPTTACNARCFYCFELGRSQIDMDEKTANDVADYILRKGRKDKIRLRWFGGEPLYNSKPIDIICEKIRDAGVQYTAEIISNGYLFDDENVRKAKELWNATDIQITLDGTEEIYNRCKNFIYNDGRSAFKIVNDNIERILKAGIIVKVRMNMDSHNEEDLYKLADYLQERFGKYENFFYYVHLLFEDSSKVQLERTDIERHMMIQKFFAFEDYIYKKQNHFPTRTVKKLIQYNQCMADDPTTTSVLPDGKLGKCEHYSDTDFWGSIYDDKIDYTVIEDFKRVKYLGKQCDECNLYPVCMQLIRCAQTIPDRCDDVDKRLFYRNIDKYISSSYRIYKQNNP